MSDAMTERNEAATRLARRAASGSGLAGLAIVGLVLVAAGPFLFDTYLLNVLIKAYFFAIAALTVDVLWGYTGVPDLRPIGILRHGRLCGGAGLHPLRVFAGRGRARAAGRGGRNGAAGGHRGRVVLLSWRVAVLRHGDIAGPAHRADPAGAVRRRVDGFQLRTDRLRQLRAVAGRLVLGGRGRAGPSPARRAGCWCAATAAAC